MAVVTISRQFGSLGDEIGQAIARDLDVPYLDKEIVQLTAARVGVTEADVLDPERRPTSMNRLIPLLVLGELATSGRVVVDPAAAPEAARGAVYREVMTEVIRELATGGDAVIVGRGGQMILRTTPGVLHVSVGAALQTRVGRVAAQTGLDPDAAARLIEEHDRARADFLRTEHGVDWQAPALYDLTLTTDRLPVEVAVAAIAAAARALMAHVRAEPAYRRLRRDHYTVKEAADLLRRNPEVIRHAVYAGALPATRAGTTITSIRRQDLLGWLEREAATAHN